ncbi:MAG: hypothetical protein HYW48_07920 [Deltaproteobacteria bacterium]|nr:hypothetical protein [Deltaproteobacteria bacterium]
MARRSFGLTLLIIVFGKKNLWRGPFLKKSSPPHLPQKTLDIEVFKKGLGERTFFKKFFPKLIILNTIVETLRNLGLTKSMQIAE